MQKQIGSSSSDVKEKTKNSQTLDVVKHVSHSTLPPTVKHIEKPMLLLDILTVQETYDDYMELTDTYVMIYSTKFQAMRNQWFWELACNKGYFVHRLRTRETVLRPVLRLYNSVTDVTSEALSSFYDLKQPLLGTRSRRPTEPYCRAARQLWLQYNMPRRPPGRYRLHSLTAVSCPPPTVYTYQVNALLSRSLSAFQELDDFVTFPVLSGLREYFQDLADFLGKMTTLREKCWGSGGGQAAEHLSLAVWPWQAASLNSQSQRQYEVTADEDDAKADSVAPTPDRQELHASRDISVCLLYRMSLMTHSILQYLVFINIRGQAVRELADEVLLVAIRQQVTESLLEMYLEPSTRIVDALFEAVMIRVATQVLKSGSSSKHLRVRALHQCRLGTAVASWQLATLLLASVGEAFSGAVIAEYGREDKKSKYCTNSLTLIPRVKDDCLYRLFNALRLTHRKLGLLQAQHKGPLDPVTSKAVIIITKITVTYALHLFRTRRMPPRHVYLRRRELQEDFSRFLACLDGRFSVAAPQTPTTVDTLSRGRLRLFMVDMLVRYYTEVDEASGEGQQAVPE